MTVSHTVAVIVGSLRKDSLNRKMAKALIAMAPSTLAMEIVEIGELPLYNQDYESAPPPSVQTFKAAVSKKDAVLFITPEYNRSIPGVLKNAIDVGSRPRETSAWNGKPAAVMSLSPGAIGGIAANHHLRQALVFLDMPTLQQPEAYIGNAAKLFDESGAIAVDSTREFLQKFLSAFEKWIERTAPSRSA